MNLNDFFMEHNSSVDALTVYTIGTSNIRNIIQLYLHSFQLCIEIIQKKDAHINGELYYVRIKQYIHNTTFVSGYSEYKHGFPIRNA